MKTRILSGLLAVSVALGWSPGSAEEKAPTVYPLAVLTFEERGAGAKDYGQKVSDLLFAKLAVKPELFLVDRSEMRKILAEQELNLSGAVKASEATKVGQLTGAKILVTGSVIHVDRQLYLVAKIIGTETSRVMAAEASGKITDELGSLVAKLADQIAETVDKQADKLVAKAVAKVDRMAGLKAKLKKGQRPAVLVSIRERHLGQATFDPAAQTEITLFCREAGFEAIDPDEGPKSKADVLITGEGLSEFAARHGNLISVKARVEIKVVDRKTERVLVADRQTAVVVDLTENLAGKAALQEAAAALAERLLPKLIKE